MTTAKFGQLTLRCSNAGPRNFESTSGLRHEDSTKLVLGDRGHFGAPVALKPALEQSWEVKATVEACAEDLAQANEGVKRAIAAGATTLPARQTLDHNGAVETRAQECADDLESVTKTLAQGINDLKVVEVALASSRTALAETIDSLESALASEERANLRALHDHATGSPSLALFNDRLSQALALADRHGWTVAVMFSISIASRT